MILCIDPGYSASGGTGLALFERLSGTLQRAALIRPGKEKDLLARVRTVTLGSINWLDLTLVEAVIAEWPQVYSGSVADPNALLGLAAVSAAIASLYPYVEHRSVLPRTWKGSLDGEVMAQRIEGRLSPEEVARIEDCPASLRHNVLDAVGIGLYHFGRLERKRVIRR